MLRASQSITLCPLKTPYCTLLWGVAKGCFVSWVAKLKGGRNSECRLSNGRSQSYKGIKLLLFSKLQRDKSASQSSMELYYPWTSGPLRVSWSFLLFSEKCSRWDAFWRASRCRGRYRMLRWNVRCFFASPSMRNHRNQFSVISMVFPQILDDFPSISIEFLSFQSVSLNFSQFQSILISSNQFDSVKNAGIYWQPEGGGNNTKGMGHYMIWSD